MWHIHIEYDSNKWIVRKDKSQLTLYKGSYLGAIWHGLSLVKTGEKICLHKKNGAVRRIL